MDDFSSGYRCRSDEELLQLWVERSQLTPEARGALEDEIHKRALTKEAQSATDAWAKQLWRMPPALKFSGLVLLHIIVAIFGAAFVDGALRWAIPPRSITAIISGVWITSVLGAASLGFGLWRIWRSPAGKWTWVVPTAWFAFGILVLAGGKDTFGQLTGFGTKVSNAAEVRNCFLFTVPFVRAVSYSLGVYVSSVLDPAAPFDVAGHSAVEHAAAEQ